MLSAGIVRSDNALVVSFVKLFLFPNLLSCILFAWTCFFIATISTGPSSWGDPLPKKLVLMIVHKEPSSFPLVGLAFFGFVLIGAMGGASGVLLPSQIAYYDVNTSIIGLLFFTFSAGYVLSAGSAGLFIQKIGQRWYLTWGTAIC